ncbi:MAG TPA: NifU family protein [Acidimicrobiales bacterium]|jgi:Fe/S biogenesis protein NfuA|nr:NifU family protein [Acidimicrobiales bacterium]
MADDEILRVTEPAQAMVLDIRSGEDNAASLALWLEVNGAANGSYTYDMWFQPAVDAGSSDGVVTFGDLTVIVAASSVDKMRGATLDVGKGGDEGLVMLNPNAPAPARRTAANYPEPDLSTPVAQKIIEILEQEVNPQIAMHGGWADLVAFDDGTAYVRMSGGCQGCGLAKVTLSQGIAVAIKDAVPEVSEIVDVTDHASGENPYYEPAKK